MKHMLLIAYVNMCNGYQQHTNPEQAVRVLGFESNNLLKPAEGQR